MALLIVAPGPLATIQDRGRSGFREFGVPVSGAFDRQSLIVANSLLGNEPDAAALEMTGFGGVFRAQRDLAIAVAGAGMAARIERASGAEIVLRVPQSASLRCGDSLTVGAATTGHRAYLSVRGGWRSPVVLGSRSSETPLRAGDVLPAATSTTPTRRPSPELLPEVDDGPFRYVDAADADRCLSADWDQGEFRVGGASDRMGLRLEGVAIAVEIDVARRSSPVAPGSIQVAGGQPIVLGPACGTLGGYPHIAQVISADLDRLAQVRPGVTIRFERVNLALARRLDRERMRALASLRLRLDVASRL